jgi:glutamate mutase epsilon subunit
MLKKKLIPKATKEFTMVMIDEDTIDKELENVIKNLSDMKEEKSLDLIRKLIKIQVMNDNKLSAFEDSIKSCIEAIEALTNAVECIDSSNDRLRNILQRIVNNCMSMDNRLTSEVEEIKNKINN